MTDREKLIALLKSNMNVLKAAGTSATATLRLADHLIANGVRLEKKQATSEESKRLIDANAISNGIALYLAENAYLNDTAQGALEMVAKWVNDAPTVDGEEVAHGRWIVHHEGGNNWCECSECNTVGSPFWKRCPVCEAKMEIEAPKQKKSCINCENDGFDVPQCKDCNPSNGFAYHRKKV